MKLAKLKLPICRPFGLSLLFLLASCGDSANEQSNPTEVAAVMADATTHVATADKSCASSAGFEIHCGFHNPEDLVVLPGGEALLVSEMGEFMVHEPSGFALLNLKTGSREEVSIDWAGSTNDAQWGDANCPAPDSTLFSPHGIDLMQREDDRYQVLAVNHGGRESVEFFELERPEDAAWLLTWRGCAIPPEDPFINDVAGLKDGGFLVTHMWNKNQPFEKVVEQLLSGQKTGWVYEWQMASGFNKLPASIENMPNGIAVSADNTKIFVNIYIGNKTIRIDRDSGEVDGEFAVQQPDNITVDSAGRLWVASHKHDPINQSCTEPGVCLLPFEILSADPETLETRVEVSHQGAPMGYSTVGLHFDGRVFMGSAHGDRIASYPVGP